MKKYLSMLTMLAVCSIAVASENNSMREVTQPGSIGRIFEVSADCEMGTIMAEMNSLEATENLRGAREAIFSGRISREKALCRYDSKIAQFDELFSQTNDPQWKRIADYHKLNREIIAREGGLAPAAPASAEEASFGSGFKNKNKFFGSKNK